MITIVSGLPRSGTSLMMQILKSGGMEILTDEIRQPDVNNKNGYFEYEKVKSLMKDNSWLEEADGKAVKIIAQLIPYILPGFNYNVIFMQRDIDEILDSQEKMIENLGGRQTTIAKDAIKKVYDGQVKKAEKYISENENIKSVVVDFNKLVLGDTSIIEKMNDQFKLSLNLNNALNVIDKSLYRSRV